MLHIQDQCLTCPTFNASELNSKRLQEPKSQHILDALFSATRWYRLTNDSSQTYTDIF